MVRILTYFLIMLFDISLQSTWLSKIEIFGGKFNSIIVFIVCFSLIRGEKEGAILGFLTGLAQDIIFGKFFGFYALLGMYLGFATGKMNKKFVKENLFVGILFTFLGTVAYEFLVYFFLVLAKGYTNAENYILNIILPESIGNLVLAFFIYSFIIWVEGKIKALGPSIKNEY